jgi:hypothetical protein
LAFYDCPEPALIIGDFSKGLGAAVAAKAAVDLKWDIVGQTTVGFPVTDEVVVGEENGKEQRVYLQLCEWHAVEAIRRHLTSAGRYKKKQKEKLTDLLWAWVKAPDIESLDKQRQELLEALHPAERVYILEYYQPKEPQFCRAYTQTYLNLGVHSTQRNESYHVVVKQKLHKHLSLSKAIRTISEKMADLGRQYDAEINRNRVTLPRLLDRAGFSQIGKKLTHYTLEIAMREWSAAKRLADNIQTGQEELDFEPKKACLKGCTAPARYGIPCQHWLYAAAVNDIPIPLSLFHPRWLLDGPAVLYKRWEMSWDLAYNPQHDGKDRYAGDRFANRGEDVIQEAALAALETLRALPAHQAERFASIFKKGTDQLTIAQSKITAGFESLPLTLPEPLKEANLRQFPSSRKRAMTGREAAEQEERDAAWQRRREQISAAALTAADSAIEARQQERDEEAALVAEHWLSSQNAHTQSQSQLTELDSDEFLSLSDLGLDKSNGDSDSDSKETEEGELSSSDSEASDGEPRRSGRVKKVSRTVASQLSQERALAQRKAEAKAKREGKGKKIRKSKMKEVSQLLAEFETNLIE